MLDPNVTRLMQELGAGFVDPFPGAITTWHGSWLERYKLVWNDQVLREGTHFSDHSIPAIATLMVILYSNLEHHLGERSLIVKVAAGLTEPDVRD